MIGKVELFWDDGQRTSFSVCRFSGDTVPGAEISHPPTSKRQEEGMSIYDNKIRQGLTLNVAADRNMWSVLHLGASLCLRPAMFMSGHDEWITIIFSITASLCPPPFWLTSAFHYTLLINQLVHCLTRKTTSIMSVRYKFIGNKHKFHKYMLVDLPTIQLWSEFPKSRSVFICIWLKLLLFIN